MIFLKVLHFTICNLILFFFKISKVFGQISDSMNIAVFGFHFFKNLLTAKLRSNGAKIIFKFEFSSFNSLYEVIVEVIK